MKIGFTGSQRGMTDAQREVLEHVLRDFGGGELHHGDCIGADAQAHELATSLGYEIVVHPPVKNAKRAFKSATRVHEPKPYLDRNKEIVHATDLLVATPAQSLEQVRSGTWSTIRYAVKSSRPVFRILPRGEIVKTGGA